MRDRVVKEGQSDGTTELLTSYTYDALGNKLTDLSPLDAQNGCTSTNSYTYDYAGRLKRTTDPLGNTSSTSYDWLGNVTSKTDPSRTTVTYTYDDFGRVLTETVPIDSSNTKVTLYSYDGNGNKIQEVVYPQGTSAYLSRRTDYTYNQRNLLTEVKQYTSETEYIITAQYTYDVRGLMTSSNAGGYVTSYTYDSHGNLSSCTYPGETTPETYVYSADGKIRSCTDRNGVTKSYSYNALGNLIIMSTGSQIVNYGYYKNSLLYYETDGRIATPYTYDSYSRKISDGTASYAYDANSNLISVTIGSDVTTYSYDRAGRMLSAVNGLSATNYTYDPRGLRTSTKNYYEGSLITQTDYTYNLAGLATSLVNRDNDGNVLSSFNYTYLPDGNVASETNHNGVATNYTYDMLGRLIGEVSGASSKYYTYDNSGNRTKVIVDGVSQVLYTYNDKGQLATETTTNGETSEVKTYAYDANGNLTAKTEGIKTTNYTYDTFGRMTSAGDTYYAYKPNGLRLYKLNNGKTNSYTYVNGKVVSDGSNKYAYGLELIKSNSAYYLYNIHGDVIQLVDTSGNLLKTYDYDAYGNEITRDLNDTNPFRYCGEYYDTETGFIYLRARYYDPMVGRFTTVDPAKDGLNWYAYCNDNPVAFVDRNGLWPSWGQILSAVVTVAVTAVVVTAVVASAGAAGAAIGLGVSMAVGASGATAATITTIATAGCYAVAGAVAAFGASDVGEIFTGTNVIRDGIFRGNQKAYDGARNTLAVASAGIVGLAACNPGLKPAKSLSKPVRNVLKNKEFTNSTGKTYNYVNQSGDYNSAMRDFEKMNLTNVKQYGNGTIVGYLPDGKTVNLHAGKTVGGAPSLEIYDTINKTSIKIRYLGD